MLWHCFSAIVGDRSTYDLFAVGDLSSKYQVSANEDSLFIFVKDDDNLPITTALVSIAGKSVVFTSSELEERFVV